MALTRTQLSDLRAASVPSTGNRLALAIQLSGETQTSLGEKIGVPHVYVSDLARGRFPNITLKSAYKFAAFFGCQIEDLFPSRREAVA